MTTLGPLYLYAPRSLREHIEECGLVPDSPTARRARPDVILSTDAADAWGLTGQVAQAGEKWDLWQVDLEPGDEVRIEPSWGPHLQTVHLASAVPARRVTWIAGRRVTQAEVAWRSTPATLPASYRAADVPPLPGGALTTSYSWPVLTGPL